MPTKGVVRFEIQDKLSSKYVGPFEILERIGIVAYRLALLYIISFMCLLKKNIPNPSHIIEYEPLQLKGDISFEEYFVQIVDRKDQVLRRYIISYVKLWWSNHSVQEVT